MVSFTQVDPADLDTSRLGRRGRVSYPILKSFMEANIKLAKLDMTGFEGKNPAYLRSVLTSYINSHNLPIKLFSAQGDLHLMRLDLNNDGTPNPDWETENMKTTEGAKGHERDLTPMPINAEEVEKRGQTEMAQKHK
jgi:hypothetical protein